MAIVKTVQYAGGTRTSTLSGNIALLEDTGELIVRNGANVLTRINSDGFTYSEPSGIRRIRIGNDATGSTIGIFTSKPTIDVVNELEQA